MTWPPRLPNALRPVNGPVSVRVLADQDGTPVALQRRGWRAPRPVIRVQDRWRIDDEWWRARSISRLYHAVLFEDGTLLTIYRDLITGAWFEQR